MLRLLLVATALLTIAPEAARGAPSPAAGLPAARGAPSPAAGLSAARGAPWQRPVAGRIVGAFTFSPADPYAAGRSRGILLDAAPGSAVRAACAGRVSFAGAVARGGPTLSVRCGPLVATYQRLSTLAVARGALVLPGARIALAAGPVYLSARRADGSYIDPATLLGRRPPVLGPAPRTRLPRRGAPRPGPPPAAARIPAPAPSPSGTPFLAWLGLALLAAATPLGALVTRRRRARAAAREAVAVR